MKPILQYPNTQKSDSLFTGTGHYVYSEVLTQVVDGPDDLRSIAYTLGSFTKCSKDGLQLKKKLLQFISLF